MPCDWPISYTGCGEETLTVTELPDADKAMIEEMASSVLWNWTGQAFGLCEVTVRPCPPNPAPARNRDFVVGRVGNSRSPWAPILLDGRWYNLGCGGCAGNCGGCSRGGLKLPGTVNSITSVQIGETVLDEADYRVGADGFLYLNSGKRWPRKNDLSYELGNPGTWGVTYTRGIPVPVGGQLATGILAEELAKAFCNDGSCRLPQRIQTITRQGVTASFMDSFDALDKGRTGIWAIDAWVASVMKPPRPSTVISPDFWRK